MNYEGSLIIFSISVIVTRCLYESQLKSHFDFSWSVYNLMCAIIINIFSNLWLKNLSGWVHRLCKVESKVIYVVVRMLA